MNKEIHLKNEVLFVLININFIFFYKEEYNV